MRTSPLLLTVAAAFAAATILPAHASTPQVQDERGDVAVGALDVLSATFARGAAGATSLRLELAEPPQADLPAVYSVRFRFDGCDEMIVDLRWAGPSSATGRMNATRCKAASPVAPLDATAVRVSVEGRTVRWILPAAAHGYQRGTVFEEPEARSALALRLPTGDAAELWTSAPYGDATPAGRSYRTGS